ncbi:hypothetical protein DPMN_046295 [Dreissena polymorpha]|uniref:Uncharacterized protein n=1 Tax=Dreissena polymorpha TaxID=45954 RepID=A0A9D4D860_DREPO|nr:hypothetical protein DPMN_046295 [Dreissena polymorpha]
MTSLKYWVATMYKGGTSTASFRIEIAMETAVMIRLSRLYISSYINFQTYYRDYMSIAVSTLLFGLQNWTLTIQL